MVEWLEAPISAWACISIVVVWTFILFEIHLAFWHKKE